VTEIERLRSRIAPLRTALLRHPLYGQIRRLDGLHQFMEHHVFAVWDFMSLLKALQHRLCGTRLPWTPPENRLACRFVNEIVLGEECDEDGQGGYASHFELYLDAMRQCGARTDTVENFLDAVRADPSVERALDIADVPQPVRHFVRRTFETIETGDLCAIAAVFTFGREDLLPGVFRKIVEELNEQTDGRLDRFRFYLDRHIHLDDEEHGPMATRLVSDLCGADVVKWNVAEEAAVTALQARLDLWNAVSEHLSHQ
jgi:hypothetical protein